MAGGGSRSDNISQKVTVVVQAIKYFRMGVAVEIIMNETLMVTGELTAY